MSSTQQNTKQIHWGHARQTGVRPSAAAILVSALLIAAVSTGGSSAARAADTAAAAKCDRFTAGHIAAAHHTETGVEAVALCVPSRRQSALAARPFVGSCRPTLTLASVWGTQVLWGSRIIWGARTIYRTILGVPRPSSNVIWGSGVLK